MNCHEHQLQVELETFVDRSYRSGRVLDGGGHPVELAPHSIERAQGEALRDLAIAEGAERTIEVGLALGMSALFLCQAVLPRGGRHVAIDPFQTESWNGAGLRTLRDAGVEDLVEVIEEESQLALPRLVAEGREFDLAFVDGDHRFEGVFLDLYFMTRLVRPGGLVVVDDMWMPAVRTAVAYVERNLAATLEPGRAPERLPLAPPPTEPRGAERNGRHRRAAPAERAPGAALGRVRAAVLTAQDGRPDR